MSGLRVDSMSAGISQTLENDSSAWDATRCGEDVVTQGMETSIETPDFEKVYTRYFEM